MSTPLRVDPSAAWAPEVSLPQGLRGADMLSFAGAGGAVTANPDTTAALVAERLRRISERASPKPHDTQVEFRGIPLRVKAGVFNPAHVRSTGKMADVILENPPQKGDWVLDVGTGSGVLTAYMHRMDRDLQFCVSDKDLETLKCARENFSRLGISALSLQSDLFEDIRGRYNYVVFNAPTAHPQVPSDDPGIGTVWDPSGGEIKKRFVEGLAGVLKNSQSVGLMLYSIYADYDPLAHLDLSQFKAERVGVEKDEISEFGVLVLRPA